jgi:hypothetical protein
MTIDIDQPIKGRRIGRALGRRPRVQRLQRICAAEGCDTILSRYNPRESCRPHTPTQFPRLRGRTTARA